MVVAKVLNDLERPHLFVSFMADYDFCDCCLRLILQSISTVPDAAPLTYLLLVDN